MKVVTYKIILTIAMMCSIMAVSLRYNLKSNTGTESLTCK